MQRVALIFSRKCSRVSLSLSSLFFYCVVLYCIVLYSTLSFSFYLRDELVNMMYHKADNCRIMKYNTKYNKIDLSSHY